MTRRGLHLAAVAVALSVAVTPIAGKDRPAQNVAPQTLDALARQYRDAGLPPPPPDAPLTCLPSGTWESGRAGEARPLCVVGFEVRPGGGGTSGTFLVGTQETEPTFVSGKFHLPRRLKSDQELPTDCKPHQDWQPQPAQYPINLWLVTAIQCHLRGDDRLAEQIFSRGLVHDTSAPLRLVAADAASLRDLLAATAWNHWTNVLLTAEADRPAVLARLEKLSADFPALAGTFQREYLASLRQAMVPSRAAPGSLEAKIDALVDYTENAGSDFSDDNATYDELLLCGFEAVPTFIAHLGDRRLTRAVTFRDDAPPCPRLVGDVVGDLIEDLADDDEDFPVRSYHRPPGQPMDKAAAERWWAKARVIGEEAYMTRTIFPPNVVSIMFLSERYSQDLEAVYARQLAEKPESDFQVIEKGINGCARLGRAGQRRLFHLGAASPNLERSMAAIAKIAEIDRADADTLLIEKFDHWPTEASGRGQNERVATCASDAVQASNSAEVWQAYERALFRAAPAQRVQMLRYLALAQPRPGGPDVRRLALFDLFLDDPDVPVIRPGDDAWDGPYETDKATPGARPLSVGDSTAGLLARLLNFKPPPGSEHTDDWWAKYREAARAAINRHAHESLQVPVELP